MEDSSRKIELTELFMAQADKHRCFYGTIKRELDSDGKPNDKTSLLSLVRNYINQ